MNSRWWVVFGLVILGLMGLVWMVKDHGQPEGHLRGLQTAAQDSLSKAEPAGKDNLQNDAETLPGADSTLETSLKRHETTYYYSVKAEASLELLHGEYWVIAHTEDLDRKLAEQHSFAFSLWDTSLAASGAIEKGIIQFSQPKMKSVKEYALLLACPGYAPKVVKISSSPEEEEILLKPIDPILLHVVDPQGHGLPGAQCWLRPDGHSQPPPPKHWLEGLQSRGFGTSVVTDPTGLATFPTCIPGPWNTIQVFPSEVFAGGTLVGLEPGTETTLVCKQAFSFVGRLLSKATNEPLQGSVVFAAQNESMEMKAVLTVETNDQGEFFAERLPAEVPFVMANAFAEGYVTQILYLPNPEIDEAIERDIFLEEASSVRLRLLTSWGEPVPNTLISFREHRYGWESPALTTDEQGVVLFPPVLPKGKPLAAILKVEQGFWMRAESNLVPGIEELIVDHLCRIQSITVRGQISAADAITECSWHSLAEECPGEVQWKYGEVSPLLATGPGILELTTASGKNSRQPISLQEGCENLVDFFFHPTQITFQWKGESPAQATLVDAFGGTPITFSIEPGSVELACWPGTFSLTLEDGTNTRTLGPLQVPGEGLDLGSLEMAGDTGVVFGSVVDEKNHPIAGVFVDLREIGGPGVYFGGTDAGGLFSIGAVPAGEYELVISGDYLYGGRLPDARIPVFLQDEEKAGPYEMTLSMEDGLKGVVTPRSPAGGTAWIQRQTHVESKDLSALGTFQFALPQTDVWVGVSLLKRGALLLNAQTIGPGEHNVQVSWPPPKNTVKMVDESGEPRTDLDLQVFLDGQVLPFRAVPDAEGELEIGFPSGFPGVVQIKTPQGEASVWSAESLMTTDAITIPKIGGRDRVLVRSEDGHPLGMALAMRFGVGDVLRTDAQGVVELPPFDGQHPFLFHARGFLNVWDDGIGDREVVLFPLLSGFSLDLGDARMQVESSMHHVVSLELEAVTLPTEMAAFAPQFLNLPPKQRVSLPNLARGVYLAKLRDKEGNTLFQKQITITESGQTFEW